MTSQNQRSRWATDEDERVMAIAQSPARDPEAFEALAQELGRTTKAVSVRWSRLRDFRESLRQDGQVMARALAALDDGIEALVALTTAHTQALQALLDRIKDIEETITAPVDVPMSEPEPKSDPLARWRKDS